jgi:hypothetical protein
MSSRQKNNKETSELNDNTVQGYLTDPKATEYTVLQQTTDHFIKQMLF